MLFAEVAATSSDVASTSSRTAKRDAIAALLARLEPGEVEPVVGFLTGAVRQGRIGVGWRSLANAEQSPAAEPSLTVLDVDRAVSELQVLSGPGSVIERRALLGSLLGAATVDEARFLTFLLGGELRQGASEGVMLDAVAAAWSVPAAVVRRAVMLGGRIDTVARLAAVGGVDAVRSVGLELGRPLQPMLASTASSVTEAVEATKGPASVEWKLDGIRIQVHRRADRVRVWTRNLNDITDRLPGVVDAVLGLPVDSVVLDGEALVGRRRRSAPHVPGHDGRRGAAPVLLRRHAPRRRGPDRPAAERTARDVGPDRRAVATARHLDRRPRGRGVGARRGDRRGPRRSRREVARLDLRGRATGQGVAQGETGAHLRPGRARCRVGPRASHRLAVEPAPRAHEPTTARS